MGKSLLFFFFIFIIIIFSAESANSSCPVDLSYVHTYPWDKSSCLDPNGKHCCTTLRSLVGVALAQNLRDASLFQFPNETASAACLSEIQGELTALSISSSIVSTCFPNPNQFSSNASSCAGIITIEDWKCDAQNKGKRRTREREEKGKTPTSNWKQGRGVTRAYKGNGHLSLISHICISLNKIWEVLKSPLA